MKRTLMIAAAVGVLMAIAIAGSANAAKEEKPDPFAVTETNVDADGNIKVHEQGTVLVDVTNSDLTVTVDDSTPLDVDVVSSAPVELGETSVAVLGEMRDYLADIASAAPAPQPAEVNAVRYNEFVIDESIFDITTEAYIWEFDPILATNLMVQGENDELIVWAFNIAESEFDHANLGNQVVNLGQDGKDWPNVTSIPFTAPVRMDTIWVWCKHASENCEVSISILGYEPGS